MTRYTIPLQNVPNQKLTTIVNNQTILLNLYTLGDYLFADFYLNGTLLWSGIKCNQGVYLNQYVSDFVGYLFFWDTTDAEPNYNNFATTCTLNYSDTDLLTSYYDTWSATNG